MRGMRQKEAYVCLYLARRSACAHQLTLLLKINIFAIQLSQDILCHTQLIL